MKTYMKSNNYDPKWVSDNWMGPNPLWLLEELCEHLDLKPGIVFLGGKVSTIFSAI